MIFESSRPTTTTASALARSTPPRRSVRPTTTTMTLQRKCACGGESVAGGECAECRRKREQQQSPSSVVGSNAGHGFDRVRLQRKPFTVNPPGDEFEREADRVADAVVGGRPVTDAAAGWGHPTGGGGPSAATVQRQEPPEKPRDQPPTSFPPQEQPKHGQEKEDETKEKLKTGGLKAAGELGKFLWDQFSNSTEGKRILAANEHDWKPILKFFEDFAGTIFGKITLGTAAGGAVAGMAAGAWASREPASDDPAARAPAVPGGAPKDEKYLALELNWDFVTPPSGLTLKTPWLDTPKIPLGTPPPTATPGLGAPPVTFQPAPKIPRICTPSDPQGDRGEADARSAFIFWWLQQNQAAAEKRQRELLENTQLRAPPRYAPSVLKPLFKRGPDAAPGAAYDPAAVEAGLRSPGQPLDGATRAFMEARFGGHDFGDVRVHRGAPAAASARAVDALAYTVGRDIVFREDAFAPYTTAGRRLLAHELAHVVQQGQGRVATGGTTVAQRVVPAGLEVKGRQTGTGPAGSWSVFFERNGDTLDSDGQTAVLLAGGGADRKQAFDLRGHVSEDEATSPAVGKALADKRINTVDAELKSVGHTGKRNPRPQPDVGDGRLDYRGVRAVEIAPAGAKAATPDCKVTAADGPCGAPAEKGLTDTRKKAQGHIDTARRLLTAGTDAGTNDLRDEFFGGGGNKGSGAAVSATIDTNLGKIRNQMDLVVKATQHRCGTVCDGACTSAIAYNTDVGSTSMLTLCPKFVSSDLRERTRNFIHEVAHATPDIGPTGKIAGTDDLAYRTERRLPRLTPSQALQNSDSYSLFVMLAADPSFARPKRPADTVSGVTKASDQGGVRDALTLLADWLKWSGQETSGTYKTMAESRPPKTAWTNAYYADTMKLIVAQFGLTMPPTLPTDDDRFAVAGISDRFKNLHTRVRGDLKVTRDPAAKKTAWSAGPGDAVTLGDDFFALSTPDARVRLLMGALVAQAKDIVPAQEPKFVALAEALNARHPLPP